MDAVIDVQGVEKMYRRKVHALRGVDLQVGSGEIFGLLGPNGAGKSTLVKVLLTVIKPTKCTGSMLGSKIGDKSALRDVGYLPEHHNFPNYLTSRQLLRHFGAMSGVDRRTRNTRCDELLELVNMIDSANDKLGSYSKGMRQRVGIAQALMNDPKLVILDEPTDGVDPIGRRDIREVLVRLKDQGRTIFLNSHLLSELEMVCDRVAIMVHGLMHQQGTIDELTKDQSGYLIEFDNPIPDELMSGLKAAVNGATCLKGVDNTSIRFDLDDPKLIQPAIDTLRQHQITIKSIAHQRPSLEDLFIQVVGNQGGATPGAQSIRKGGHQ